MTSRRTLGVPPIATAVTLAAVLAWNITTNARPSASPQYLAHVREAVEALPFAIGPLVGTELEVVPAAARMLRPNVILQRTYRDPLGSDSLDLIIVHCEDVRDLEGHYPPVCYPNAGWDATEKPVDAAVTSDLGEIRARQYGFERHVGLNRQGVRILSFFVLPKGEVRFAPDMVEVRRAARSPKTAGLGAMHIMLVTPAAQPDEVTRRLTDDVFGVLQPILHAMTEFTVVESAL